MPRLELIKLRGDTAAQWGLINPVLLEREVGIETDTLKMKIGDGSSVWSALDYTYDEVGTAEFLISQLGDAAQEDVSVIDGVAPGLSTLLSKTSSLIILGTSYVAADPPGSPAKEGVAAVYQRLFQLPDGQVKNIAVSGSQLRHNTSDNGLYQSSMGIWDIFQAIDPGPLSAPRTPSCGVFSVNYGTNDGINNFINIVGAGQFEDTYREAYLSLFECLRAGSRYAYTHASVTKTGTWVNHLYSSDEHPCGSGEGEWQSSTPGDVITITTPTDMGRGFEGAWVTIPIPTAYAGATVTVRLDGVVHGTLTTSDRWGPGAPTHRGCKTYRIWVPTTYTNADVGLVTQHTITLTINSVQHSGPFRFTCYQITAEVPPIGLAVDMAQPAWSLDNTGWAVLHDPAIHDRCNVIQQEVCDEINNPTDSLSFPLTEKTAIRVDMDDPVYGVDGNTATWSKNSNRKFFNHLDGLHPNAYGSGRYGAATLKALVEAFGDGLPIEQMFHYGKWELPPLQDNSPVLVGEGPPFSLYDDFERGLSVVMADVDHPWEPLVGSWGIDDIGQSYVSKDRFSGQVAYDDFGRVDSNTSMNSPILTTRRGVQGISSGHAYPVSHSGGLPSIATVNTGSTSQWAEFLEVGTTNGITYDQGLVLRYVDINNWIAVVMSTVVGGYYIRKCIGGTLSLITDGGAVFTDLAFGDKTVHAEVGTDNKIRLWTKSSLGNIVAGNPAKAYTIPDAVLQSGGAGTHVGRFWGPSSTTASTSNYFAYGATATNYNATAEPIADLVVVDFDFADGVIGSLVGSDGTLAENYAGLAFRVADALNYYHLGMSANYGGWVLRKIVNGVVDSSFASGVGYINIKGANAPNTQVAIVMNGNQFTFYFNSVVSVSGTKTDSAASGTFLTAQKHGLISHYAIGGNHGTRWRDYRVGYVPIFGKRGQFYVDTSTPGEISWWGPFDINGSWGSSGTLIPLSNPAPRVTTITSSATPAIDTEVCDVVDITNLSVAITSMTINLTGYPPNNFQKLTIRIKDNGSAHSIAWGIKWASRGATLPTTTVAGKLLTIDFVWNSIYDTWDCILVAQEA